MNKDAKIYVAGHTGLVGSALVRGLAVHGYNSIITRTVDQLDLRRQSAVEDFFAKEKPEYVFLAAAKVGGILANNTYKAEFIYDNLIISANIIHASYKFGVKKLINLGSSCIYPKNAPQPLKENYLLTSSLEATNEPYAIAKIAALKLCRYYNEQYNTNFISVMPTNLYGPNDNFDLETSHVLPALIRKFHLAKLLSKKNMDAIRIDLIHHKACIDVIALTNTQLVNYLSSFGIYSEKVVLWGTGKPYREFLYVDDLVSALLMIMFDTSDYKFGEITNIGTGDDLTITSLADRVKRVVGFKGAVVFDSGYPDGTLKKLLDVSCIKTFGWKSKISLFEGIDKVYNSYLSRFFIKESHSNEVCTT